MFEALIARIERRSARRAAEVARDVAESLTASAPASVSVVADENDVRLVGRGLVRRFALDPALRWLVAGVVRR